MAHQLVNGAFGADDGQGEICPELTHRYAILKQKSGEDAIPVMLHVSVTDTRHEKPRNLCLPSIPTVGIQCNLNLPLPYRLRSRFGSEAIVDSIFNISTRSVRRARDHRTPAILPNQRIVPSLGVWVCNAYMREAYRHDRGPTTGENLR